MYTKTPSYYFVCLTLAVVYATFPTCSPASTDIVSFDFDDSNGSFENAPEILNFGLATLPWAVQRGTLTDFSGSPSSGRAIGARSFVDGNSLIFELIVEHGFSASIDGYAYSGGGLSGNYDLVNGALSLEDLTGSVFIAVAGSAASSNSGTYRLDNFVLTGTVSSVPLAPSLLLFGSGLSLLGFRLKR